MSNASVIAAVTGALVNILTNRFNSDPSLSGVNVTSFPIDKARNGTNTNSNQLNLYLYQTLPNAGWRNLDSPGVVRPGENGITEADILIHDINLIDPSVAFMLARMEQPDFPQPVGIFRAVDRPSYDQMLVDQIDTAIAKSGPGSLEKLIYSGDMWIVE